MTEKINQLLAKAEKCWQCGDKEGAQWYLSRIQQLKQMAS